MKQIVEELVGVTGGSVRTETESEDDKEPIGSAEKKGTPYGATPIDETDVKDV